MGGLIKRADFAGITDYVLQVLPREKEVSWKKKESLRKVMPEMRPGGFHFRDLWGSLRERQACDFRTDLGFTVISSYLTLALQRFCLTILLFLLRPRERDTKPRTSIPIHPVMPGFRSS